LGQLVCAHAARVVHVRPAAQVAEVALGVDRDGLVLGQRFDEFALERLAFETVPRLEAVEFAALERDRLGDDLAHARLDGDEVLRRERAVDAEVVVEAVLDRRADAEGRGREQVLDRFRHHVRRRVPQDVEALGAVLSHDGDRGPVRHYRVDVDGAAIDAAGDSSRGQARTDGGRDPQHGRSFGHGLRAAIRQRDGDVGHGDSFRALCAEA